MTAASASKPPRDTLNLRISAAQRQLIDRAAQSAGKTRTDFILEAASRAAEETLLDRTLLLVGAEAYAEFVKRLDAAPEPNEHLRRTMNSPTPWDAI